MHDLVLSLPSSVWKKTFLAPVSQKQVGKMRDLLQVLQLLGTALRLESRLCPFKLYALRLTPTADSEFGWRGGWVGQAISSWSCGGGKVLGWKQTRSTCRTERDNYSRILQGPDPAGPSGTSWHVGGALRCQLEVPVVATVAQGIAWSDPGLGEVGILWWRTGFGGDFGRQRKCFPAGLSLLSKPEGGIRGTGSRWAWQFGEVHMPDIGGSLA